MNYEVKQTFSGRWANSTLHTHTHTQLLAQEPKWTIHNSIVDYQNSTTSPLPNVPNPDYTQNAIWDANGNLKVYEADGKIYNANGGLILDMKSEATNSNFYPSPIIVAGFTEFIFVPVPDSIGTCDQYYGISTYSNGNWYGSGPYITDVIWCKIDLSNGLGSAVVLPQSGLRVAKESITCEERGTQGEGKPDYQMHIEVTNTLSNGNRYLFVSNKSCVSVLNLTSSNITFIDGYNTGGKFAPNLRSEMEVYQTDNTYEVAMSYYNQSIQNGLSYATIFEFDMSGTPLPLISHYDVHIPGEPNQDRIVKGLEYSEDGLKLYASIMTINSTYTSILSGNNIIYFERPSLGTPFTYGGVITAGASTQDFGLGMLEKGVDHKLWAVGEGRLGTMADYNNPLSAFVPNAMPISNQLTNASGYNNGTQGSSPSLDDILNRKMYLLVDQIDGEDYTSWTTGSDLYPSLIEVCSFPYTFPYMIPANAIIWYSGQTAPNGDLLTGGTMGISYMLPNGCEYTETINIILKEEQRCDDAKFTRSITESVEPDVLVAAVCDIPGVTNHEYYLYESDGQGGWILLSTCFSANCTLTGLYNGQSFKIVHNIYNINSTCHPFVTSTQYFTIN